MRMSTFEVFKKLTLAVLPVAILISYYTAYFPGCYTADSYAYLQVFNDHHPLLFLIYIRFIEFLMGGFNGYVLINILLFSFIFSRTLLFFLKLGVRFSVLLFLGITVPLLPNTGYMMITYWKDVLYAIAIFYLTFLLIKMMLSIYIKTYLNRFYFLELYFAFLFILGSRHNGILTVFFTSVFLFWIVMEHRKKTAQIFAFSFISVFLANNIAKQFFGADGGWMTADHILFRHLSVYLHEKKLDKDGVSLLYQILPKQAYCEGFNYFSHDGFAYGAYSLMYRVNVPKHKWELRRVFIRHLANKPIVFIKSELLMTQLIWRPIPYSGSYRYSYCTGNDVGNKGLVGIFNYLLKQSDRIDKPFYTRIFFWSGSLQVWLIFFLAISAVLLSKKIALLAFLAVAGNVISLFATLVAQDFRYLYGEVLTFPLFLLFVYFLIQHKRIKRENITFS
jgi:hypothetical protein